MDPAALPSVLASLVNAVRAVQAEAPAAPALPELLALVGQEVAMTYLGAGADGTLALALPSGQVVTAQGQLPFPAGTQLQVQVQVQAGDGAVRLQTLRATPPASPDLLAPLVQGEAADLLAGLSRTDPPDSLAQLAELFQLLGGTAAGGTPATGTAPPAAAAPPAERIRAALADLPPADASALKTLLGLGPEAGTADLADALESWLAAAADSSAGPLSAPTAQGVLVQRLQTALDQHPQVPRDQAEALVAWVRGVFRDPGAQAAAPARDLPSVPVPANPATPAQALRALLAGRSEAPAEVPETWQTWIRASAKALSDPAVSPQGAAFHAAQALDGTAYFEIPLPWAPQQPLQLWVEEDRESRSGAGDATHRVLLGLSFTNLGETRLGVAQGPAGLQVRVWAEHPERLAAAEAAVKQDLEELDSRVDLRILPLPPGPDGTVPSVRSQVVGGGSIQALG